MAALQNNSIPALLHTKMDQVNKAAERARALQSLLPSLAGFLDGGEAAAATGDAEAGAGGEQDSVSAGRCDFSRPGDLDYAAAGRALRAEGPIDYTDLRMGVCCDRPVEVWIDTLAGLHRSALPRQDRFLFLFEPEEVTRLRGRLVGDGEQCARDHFGHVFCHDPETAAALRATAADSGETTSHGFGVSLFPHGGTWILPSAIEAYAKQIKERAGQRDTAAAAAAAASPPPAAAATAAAVSLSRPGKTKRNHEEGGGKKEESTTLAGARFARRAKRLGASFVCGAKRQTRGHRLRRVLWATAPRAWRVRRGQHEPNPPRLVLFSSGVDGPGKEVAAEGEDEEDGDADLISTPVLPAPPAAKLLAFDWMFHVAIENVNRRDYFTEKLLDCFLTRTVPVYWGCPNIGKYFDRDGIIHIHDDDDPDGGVDDMGAAGSTTPGGGDSGGAGSGVDDPEVASLQRVAARITAAVSALTAADYLNRQQAVDRNFHLARGFIDQRTRMEAAIATASANRET